VIATDINGCNEIIEHNKRGLLVPSKDTGALYRAMVSMAEDSHRRIAFGERAGAFVIENFDQQVVWKELLKEYERSLKYSPQAQSQEVK
jgi:glycosyltransferase involved in cell wall biosynthesis